MRDPLDELKNLDAGTAGRALPAAEVRRRGDRMRRRRTAFQALGAAAAVAVIASGGAFVTSNLTSAESPVGPAAPTTSPSPTPTTQEAPDGGWLTAPPQGFPLDALLPETPRESGDASLFACSDATAIPELDTAVYSEGVWVPGPGQQDRQLYLFPSGTDARSAYESVLQTWRTCPPAALEERAELRNEVTAVRPDRFWVFREAFDANGEAAPELGPASIHEVRLYGNALVAASIWEPSGESPLLTAAGRDFESALTQIDAASCVFLAEGCGDDVVEPASPSSVTEVPEGFPVDQGLPEAGGDVPEWLRAAGPEVPLSPIACGPPEEAVMATQPVDSRRVEVAPPDESQWRHLLLFQDGPSAGQAFAQLRSFAAACAELTGSDDAEPMQMRWSFTQAREHGLRILVVEGGMFATGTDTRVPGRTMTRVIQVGNAVLVARLDDASSASGKDDAARELDAEVASIAKAMCVFGEEACERP